MTAVARVQRSSDAAPTTDPRRSVSRARDSGLTVILLDSASPIVLGARASRPTGRTLVVGYDGSPIGQAAVEAGLHAGETGRVFVVYAYDAPSGLLPWPYLGRS
jgi:hypothetical protein